MEEKWRTGWKGWGENNTDPFPPENFFFSSSFTSTACISCLLAFVVLFLPLLKTKILKPKAKSNWNLGLKQTGSPVNKNDWLLLSLYTQCTPDSLLKKQGVCFYYYYKYNSSIRFIFLWYAEVEKIQQLQPWRLPSPSTNESNEIFPITGFNHWYPPLPFRSP